jgi:hypothetical protein
VHREGRLKRAGDEREPRETKLNPRGLQNRRGQLLATAPTNRRVQHAPQNIRRDRREPLALTRAETRHNTLTE